MVASICHRSTWEDEARRLLQVQSQPWKLKGRCYIGKDNGVGSLVNLPVIHWMEPLVGSSDVFVAVIKHHDQGNQLREEFVLVPVRRVRVHSGRVEVAGGHGC